MGGGDLNMKKSWHPLLLKNQERVWLEEKKAVSILSPLLLIIQPICPLQLEEKKKLDQLRKEKEEERQLQELQRLQEEQTGKKRTEKLEWMYTTPATGSNQNPNDLEDYLLGKKRVDKILTADENAKVYPVFLFPLPFLMCCLVGSFAQELHRGSECQHCPRYCLENSRGSVTCDEATGAGCLSGTNV